MNTAASVCVKFSAAGLSRVRIMQLPMYRSTARKGAEFGRGLGLVGGQERAAAGCGAWPKRLVKVSGDALAYGRE
jgi:hypothetical protein